MTTTPNAGSETPLIERLTLRYGHPYRAGSGPLKFDLSSHQLIQEAISELIALEAKIAPPAAPPAAQSDVEVVKVHREPSGVELIAAERARQIAQEGWSSDHDDEHSDGSLVMASVSYAEHAVQRGWLLNTKGHENRYVADEFPDTWPDSWEISWWKPKDPLRDLVRAGALIAAEIDRLHRAMLAASKKEGTP